MPKKKEPKGTKVSLKAARLAMRMTPDGRHRLTLSNMGITVFPACIFKLPHVQELDLSCNRIQKIPDHIGKLSALKSLDLHSNKLKAVPETISNLEALTHLNLANNCLTSVSLPPTLGGLTSLKSLNLGMNQLDSLPPTLGELQDLQELGLFDNLFVTLPEFLSKLQNLTKLNTKRNPLMDQERGRGLKLKSEPGEYVYLVHENILCRPCLKRCKDKGKSCKGGKGGGDDFEEKRIRNFTGLTAPNSVAIVNQDLWRIRKMGRRIDNRSTISVA